MKRVISGPPAVIDRRPERVPVPYAPTYHRHETGRMDLNYRWQVLLALTVPPGLSASWFGIMLLSEKPFLAAAKQAGYVLAVSFGILIFVLPLAALVIHYILQFLTVRPLPARPRSRKEKRRPVPFRAPGTPPKTRQEKMQEAFERIGHGAGRALRRAGETLAKAPRKRRGRVFAKDAQVVEAREVSPAEQMREELFIVTHHMYHKKLTRPSFKMEYEGIVPNWQDLYNQMRDWWARLGWVSEDGRGEMRFLFDEAELYWTDRGMRKTAQRMGFKFPQDGGGQ